MENWDRIPKEVWYDKIHFNLKIWTSIYKNSVLIKKKIYIYKQTWANEKMVCFIQGNLDGRIRTDDLVKSKIAHKPRGILVS